jgi:hypothetical protein
MRACSIPAMTLLAVTSFAAQAAALSLDAPRSAMLLRTPDDFNGPKNVEAPILAGPQTHYLVRASGLDRIDPADFKIFGAQIGGNGVQGGAVVSLSWPAEH